jgi:FtsP/CotA-like multicopper oxidase with cupredoxin domain
VRRVKRLLLWSLALVALGVVAFATAGVIVYSRADISTVGELRFENELRIPPLLRPRDEDGRRVFELTLEGGRAELLPGKRAETWGANGSYLGPTLRAGRGEQVQVRVRSALPEATTIHWHGMHLPAVADGGPHQVIAPGEMWTPSWEVDQPAATLWYHAHPHGETADHVYRGLAGMFILDDPDADALPLPDLYGVNDIPLIIQDKGLHDDGSLDFSERLISPTGLLGDSILVNGTFDPHLEVRHQHVRLRLLNASNARIYNFGFSDDREFDLVATDGGLLEAPRKLARVQLSPGERVEIVVAFSPREQVVLRSFEPELGANFFENRFAGGDDTFDVLQVRAARTLAPSPPVPRRLVRQSPPQVEAAVRARRFDLGGRSINGNEFDLDRIDAVVEAGTTEIWEVRNASGTPHSFHPHDVRFRVLDYAGIPPPDHLRGLKDTVYLLPGERARLLVRFGEYSNPDLPYMLHCHLLQHEDRGMMGQFVVVKPGARGRAATTAGRVVEAQKGEASHVPKHSRGHRRV